MRNKKKNIFLVCYGGGHINIIEPIVDELIKNKNYNVKLLALTTAYLKVKDKYDKNILKSISDYLFLFDENIDVIFQNALKIFDENYNSSMGLSKIDILSYLGFSYSEAIEKLGEEKAYEEYEKIGRQSFLPINTIKKILDYEKVDLLITTNSPRFEKASLIAAKELNIKSIQIEDLFGDGLLEQNATYTIVMNELIKDKLIEKGFDKNTIFPLGQPAIEKTIREIQSININDFDLKNKNNNKKNLVYFSQPPIKFDKDKRISGQVGYEELNFNLFEILNRLSEKYNIYFRIHPNEKYKDYKTYFEKYTNIVYLNNMFDLSETIALSHVVVTPYSTVAIEAICCNKSVFTYKADFSDAYPIEIYKNKPFIYSDSFFHLESHLNEFIFEDKNNSFINENFFKNFHLFQKDILNYE